MLDLQAEPASEERTPAPVARDAAGPSSSAGRRRLWSRVVAVATTLLAAGALAAVCLQCRDVDLAGTLAHVRLPLVGLAICCIGASVALAAGAVAGFSPHRPPLRRGMAAQLAAGALRMLAPSAIGTSAVVTRYLVCSGIPTATAIAAVGASQTAQLLMTTAIVIVAGVAGASAVHMLNPVDTAIVLGGVALVVVVAVVASGRWAPMRRGVDHARAGLADVVGHIRQRPAVVLGGFACAAGLTATHVLAFAACLGAAGGHASMATLIGVYLAAAAAGTAVPTPGGTGAVEAAMVSGLVTAGVPTGVAAAATLLSRLVSTWLPVLPGAVALGWLRRRGLL